MAWQIYLITNSPLQLGLLGLARALPQMALALFGGVLADRVDRRRILMVTQIAQFWVSASLVGLTVAGVVTPTVLYAATMALAFCTSLETPARQAIVPNLVPARDLTSALALNTTQRDVGMIVGPALAGLLLAASGPAWCYAIDALSWLAMFVALLKIETVLETLNGRSTGILRALSDGLAFVWTNPIILSLMVLDFGATLFGSARALYPIYARDNLHVGASGLGALYAASAVGSVGGAVVISTLGQIRRAGLWTLIGVALYGASTVVFAVSPVFWLSLLMLAASGLGNMISAVLRGTINQLITPNALRGRVAALNSIFTQGGPQLGQFESGVVAQVVSTQFSAVTGGVATLVLVVGLLGVPWIRRFEFRRAGPDGGVVASAP
jgi:MFS family permease